MDLADPPSPLEAKDPNTTQGLLPLLLLLLRSQQADLSKRTWGLGTPTEYWVVPTCVLVCIYKAEKYLQPGQSANEVNSWLSPGYKGVSMI